MIFYKNIFLSLGAKFYRDNFILLGTRNGYIGSIFPLYILTLCEWLLWKAYLIIYFSNIDKTHRLQIFIKYRWIFLCYNLL